MTPQAEKAFIKFMKPYEHFDPEIPMLEPEDVWSAAWQQATEASASIVDSKRTCRFCECYVYATLTEIAAAIRQLKGEG